MKIESLIRRKNGTKVDLKNPNISYHFKPESTKEKEPHLAEVTEKTHLARFLAIPEGFAIYDPSLTDTSQKQQQDKEPDEPKELKGSDYKPEVVEYGNGNSVKTSALVQSAFDASGKTVEQWNKQTAKQIKDRLTETVESLIELDAVETDDESKTDEAPEDKAPEAPKLDNADAPTPAKTKAQKQAEFKAKKAKLGQN